ncbi:MAG: hypothetical protein KC766_42285 [Myxococcales bacterium]|nr:hypothetical protein [Myxococcales bacterium]
MFLSNLTSRKTQEQRQQAEESLPEVLRAAAKDIRGLWATSTWATRGSLLLRVENFAQQHRISHLPLGVQATAFISSLRVAASTKASYCSALGATARRLGMQVPMLDLLAAATRAQPTGPTNQAVPATRPQIFLLVNTALRSNKPRLAVALYLCWKTASRWDDMIHLTKSSFLNRTTMLTDGYLVVQWAQTKANRRQEFRPDGWCVVVEQDAALGWAVELVRRTLRSLATAATPLLPPQQTTAFLRKFMRAQPETQQLTAHSIKRGAVNVLVEAAVLGRLKDPRLIPLLAKHKDSLHGFPTSTLRYVEDKKQLALMLGTQEATRLL